MSEAEDRWLGWYDPETGEWDEPRADLPAFVADDRRMNLIVRPDGSAELDDRESTTVALAVFGKGNVIAVNIDVDGRRVGRALTTNEGDVNSLARLATVELSGAHFMFYGPVVFVDLDPGTAHLMLEVARDR